MRHAIILTGIVALALAAGTQAASLNKCIDARGKITYSNLPCARASEARTVEVDPAPRPAPAQHPPRTQPAPAVVAEPASARTVPHQEKQATLHLETHSVGGEPAPRGSADRCEALSDKIGRVFDKMDAARRKGYTPAQMNAWNEQVKELERKKQQSGCF